ncbi:hypothetical protein [Flavobacterium croceum]|uniref:Uncharacterized protein n=1 Tax=Flavobacterium croceum DSM 17960 TaxID=1121886 RepID=A0A2S4N9J8_9FLAO|nr:hypothetical protein [Flavobacterium croceum]POS02355.1 hypothetical protein Q361_10474 [Flavobacterium croceum DSM 17960]
MFDVIIVFFIFIFGLLTPHFFIYDDERKYLKNLRLLWLVHVFFGVMYYFFTRNGGGDAWFYWVSSSKFTFDNFFETISKLEGTAFMVGLNSIFTQVLQLGFFANTMIYTYIGYLGIIFFYLFANRTIEYNFFLKKIPLFPWIFFLPNLHFWSSGLGKDSLLFFCIGGFFYSMLELKKRFILLLFVIILSLLIRPHITLFLFLGISISLGFDYGVSVVRKIILSFFFIGFGIIILPKVLSFTKIETLSVNSIDSKTSAQAELLTDKAGSSVNVSSYPLPLKIATFLFRPTFTDINSLNALFAAFENLFLFILFVKALRNKPLWAFKNSGFLLKAMLIYLIIGSILFSMSLGNLGIMLRMRNMFLAPFLIYMLHSLSISFVRKQTSVK